MSFQKFLLLTAALTLASCASKPTQPTPETRYAWVELGADSTPIVRVIRNGGACPDVLVDGKAKPMQTRIDANDPRFPIEVCEARIDSAASDASVEGRKLKLPQANPKKIVVIGDTGCRIKGKGKTAIVQECNDPAKWPFLDVIKTAAAENPDLVIHVGDYYYRESPCPESDPGCKGSPSGDRWDSWNADFFAPADDLLRAAPWIFVRGNHELCARGGQGWFRILDPRSYQKECDDLTPAYLVRLGNSEFAILDSAKADITMEKLKELTPLQMKNAWVLTHRPVFDPFEKVQKNTLPRNVELTLAGHVHTFQLLLSDGKRAPQIIAGNAGTALDSPTEIPVLPHRLTLGGFGYLTMERINGDRWNVIEHDPKGTATLTCTLDGKKLSCPQP